MEVGTSLKFVPFSSIVDPSFWHKLVQLKLEVDKLEERDRSLWGFYLLSSTTFHLDCSSFNRDCEFKLNSTKYTTVKYVSQMAHTISSPLLPMEGKLINLNSSEAFKRFDKNGLLEAQGAEIQKAIDNGTALKNPGLINKFVLLTFADLKSYEFIYWFAFLAPSNISAEVVENPKYLNDVYSEKQIDVLLESHEKLAKNHFWAFGVIEGSDICALKCVTLEELIEHRNLADEANGSALCFLDPSIEDNYPGWPLRNLLALASKYSCCRHSPLKIICLRIGKAFNKSFIFTLRLEDSKMAEKKWIGWEKNLREKFGPRCVNLRNDMDPVKLAETSSDLNLKLMKWRLVPDLNLEIIHEQKCLLLGAGTLGCSVARALLAWGVRNITFVDSGNVSFSNPVRQSLYNHEDCDLGGGTKQKAKIAAEALKKILPSMVSEGIVLDIPMPGHLTSDIRNVDTLLDLISSHDIIFMLTDSRESRWLPTLLSTAMKKIAITAALGFDTYLVLRHGIEDSSGFKLGCYFCNDVTAPGNSKLDRTLDQQCTVTRPGVSNIAAAIAVELMVSVLQHPLRGSSKPNEESILGSLPHSLRGFLSTFNQVTPATPAFSQCVACSQIVVDEYKKYNKAFLEKVFESNSYLEILTGLSELHRGAEVLQIWELSDDEDSE